MNFVLRLLSPLLLNLVRRYGAHWPGLEPARVARGKRRLGRALLLAAGSLVLTLAGVLVTMVDLAVQYEQHGEFSWNPVLWLSVGVLALGVVSGLGARATMPGLRDFVPFAPKGPAPARGLDERPGQAVRPPRRPEYAH